MLRMAKVCFAILAMASGSNNVGAAPQVSDANNLTISYNWGPFNGGDCPKIEGNASVANGVGTRVAKCVTQEQPSGGAPPLPPSLLSLFCNLSSDSVHLSAHYTMVDLNSGLPQNNQDGKAVTSGCSVAMAPNFGSCCF